MAEFFLSDYLPDKGIILLQVPSFDFDSFLVLGHHLVTALSAQVQEQQMDADLHTWLIDFEGTRLLLKAEHYTASMWLEALQVEHDREVFDFLATLLKRGL